MSNLSNESIEIHAEVSAKLNFAAHQNSYPVLHDLRIENLREEPQENLILKIKSDPPFIKERSWSLDQIDPKGSLLIKEGDIQISDGFLRGLTEATKGKITFLVKKDDDVVAEHTKPIELLAYNEWGGADFIPELLAAFCMPNDPFVNKILHDANEALRRAGRPTPIDGYQSGSRKRVWEIASAIYSAITNLGLTYAIPPQSFERNGQKICIPSQITNGKAATCLDTTVLFTSAFEQARLNPVIVLPEEHALAGVWLQPEEFSSVVVEEAEILRKHIDLQDLLLFETTYVMSTPQLKFSIACARGKKAIPPHMDEKFCCAIDLRQARAHNIKPLALQSKESHDVESHSTPTELTLENAPTLPDFDDTKPEEEKPATPEGRLERWQRRLLDLTLRNRLLNYRMTQTGLQIICPKPGLLEDRLASGHKIKIIPTPHSAAQEQDEEIHQQRTGESITQEYTLAQLEKNCVLVEMTEEDLRKRFVGIYRKTQTALQEGGANTLYLALGFLLWKRDEKDQKRYRAPLILLPVTLIRKSVRSGIQMCSHDDEPRFNTTLLEMLRRDFQVHLQGLDSDLPKDESGIDVTGIWNEVRRAIKDVPGFEVVEDVALGHFSFAKYLMWKDLVDRTDALRQNAVVRHLLDTPLETYGDKADFVDASEVDNEYKPSDLLMPLSADASQVAAIATTDRGKDFIIIGPPGTGKSQTISNMIAHLLGKGKRVLFVSEKTAALEVVHRRLKAVGLGNFCLELHSNKARKMDVLNQLRATWDQTTQKSEIDWHQEAKKLLGLRNQLNRIVNHLHKEHKNGLTPYYAIGVKVKDETLANRLKLSWPSAQQHDEATLQKMRDTVDKLSTQAKEIQDIDTKSFQFIKTDEWTPKWQEQTAECAGKLVTVIDTANKDYAALCEAIGFTPPDQSMARFNALRDLASLLVDSYREPIEANGLYLIHAFREAIAQLRAYAKERTSSRYTHIVVSKLANKATGYLDLQKNIQTLLRDGNDLLAPEGSIGRIATAFLKSSKEMQETIYQFESFIGESILDTFADENHVLKQLRETANTINERKYELRDWCSWQKRRLEAIDAGLQPLVEAVEQSQISPENMQEAFEAAYCTWWSTAIIEEDEILRSFSSAEHEQQIEKFCNTDEEFQKLTAQYISAKLTSKLPEQGGIKKSSQWGVIRRELEKKRRHKPIRKLLNEAPEAMTTLAPCFMMSPLSAAQYLSADQQLFDVVIFDEASQIPTWDAVGAIARGKQVITAGDPKQMPPTNFFERADDDPDGMVETEGDLESILEEMLAAGIPQITLNLHYRSRSESLIAFSNEHYYDNKLITFPDPSVKAKAINLARPEGFYASGGARHNEGEAKAIVDEIINRLQHDDPAVRRLSIGVVTFNSSQQALIEDLLDKARSDRPEIEWAFSQENKDYEPVFVKNLETVQGDERDVMLFSITYGPDRNDQMAMRFGPLNRQGGERRLNVAITRARSEMVVFSTLQPDRIDLSRTQARAVKDLKHFLEYAERGAIALRATNRGPVGDFESPFEAAVSNELKLRNWEVHPQIGVSNYRIDLGVVHPDQPGRYLAGIECDGAMYHSAATARERDKIRQSVLEGLGWTLFRIWSTDWWTHKEKEIKKIDQTLHDHLASDREKQTERADAKDKSSSGNSL